MLQKAVSWLWKRKLWPVKGTAMQNPAGGCHEREGYQVREEWFVKENLLRAQRNTLSHCTGDEEIQQNVCLVNQEDSYWTKYAKWVVVKFRRQNPRWIQWEKKKK